MTDFNKYTFRLRQIAEVLTTEKTDFAQLSECLKDYKQLLLELSGIDLEHQESRSNLDFSNGMALGTTWAALCVDDIMRTKKFVQGLFEAVRHLKKERDGALHIFYAGTGPFATLILPLLAVSSPEHIRVSLMEINTESYESVQRVFRQLNFTGFIQSTIQADATTYRIPEGEKIDILLSETMQYALHQEQQVPIILNLYRQLDKDVLLIPEKIILELGLYTYQVGLKDDEHRMESKKLAPVFELSKERIESLDDGNYRQTGFLDFPEVTVKLPYETVKKYAHLVIFTDIQVFGNQWITLNNSGLTTPWIIRNTQHLEEDDLISLTYKIDQHPRMVHRLKKAPAEIAGGNSQQPGF